MVVETEALAIEETRDFLSAHQEVLDVVQHSHAHRLHLVDCVLRVDSGLLRCLLTLSDLEAQLGESSGVGDPHQASELFN